MRMEAVARIRRANGGAPPGVRSTQPPSETRAGPIPADVQHPEGPPTGTSYQRVPEGLIDEAALAAAMKGVNR